MLLWIIMIGGFGALGLAFMAMSGPSASKALKRRMELVKERHGDIIAGNAQAQIRKLMAQRSSKIEGFATSLVPKPRSSASRWPKSPVAKWLRRSTSSPAWCLATPARKVLPLLSPRLRPAPRTWSII